VTVNRLLYAVLFTIVISVDPASAQVEPYTLDEAVERGVVDFNFNPWGTIPISPLIDHLTEINPGLINRIGFEYGGFSVDFLNALALTVRHIHLLIPKVLLGGGVNEALYLSYDQTLDCGGGLGRRHFSAADLVGRTSQGSAARFIDMSKIESQNYYICVGQILIDMGITYLHFEGPDSVIKSSSSPYEAINGYRRVHDKLVRYGIENGGRLYFSGDPFLSGVLTLDGVYIPSRFYHTSIPAYQKYQNSELTGVGKGYTYWLSDAIVRDIRKSVPSDVRVFFYVDNWDETQDDLRRMMELDDVNRRILLTRSSEVAKIEGAYFIPPLTHCEGCVLPDHVGDFCEIGPTGKSEYNAYQCADFPVIRRALEIQAASEAAKHRQ